MSCQLHVAIEDGMARGRTAPGAPSADREAVPTGAEHHHVGVAGGLLESPELMENGVNLVYDRTQVFVGQVTFPILRQERVPGDTGHDGVGLSVKANAIYQTRDGKGEPTRVEHSGQRGLRWTLMTKCVS
ncbi:hypothetical protein EW146_g8391 [Bondarzewia mesenterica]|uniref:Uncharacterized protein n=1 Tax=Bondarzewia mesenterica TaxID=1095465 RepID=A0A4S4LER1_9AGAM|nr:hypothetical protein EW146_g8391 [Bondarzewia mesenterica]